MLNPHQLFHRLWPCGFLFDIFCLPMGVLGAQLGALLSIFVAYYQLMFSQRWIFQELIAQKVRKAIYGASNKMSNEY